MSAGLFTPFLADNEEHRVTKRQILFLGSIFVIGEFAVILAKSTAGLIYAVPFFAAFVLGMFKQNLYMGLETGISVAIGLGGASWLVCIVLANAITKQTQMGALVALQLLLPTAETEPAFNAYTSQWLAGLLSGVGTVALTVAYLAYISFHEEFVFRGPVLHILAKEFGIRYGDTFGPLLAILGLGVSFGYFHFLASGSEVSSLPQSMQTAALLILSSLGVVWGLTALLARNIWATFVAHLLWNAFAMSKVAILLVQCVLPLATIPPLCLALFALAAAVLAVALVLSRVPRPLPGGTGDIVTRCETVTCGTFRLLKGGGRES